MSQRHFDAIVLGVGGMGAATAWELSRRGLRTLGLEQFDLVHDRGSSHGQTRVIRTAYYEHPSYVPLVRRSFERWYELEQLDGSRLLTECPCLNIGREDSEIVLGVRESAREHQLPIENLSSDEISHRYPALRFPGQFVGVLERQAGFLMVEECVRAMIQAAEKSNAEIRSRECVREWSSDGKRVSVKTDRESYGADRLVICAGPWAGQLLRLWGRPLRVMRQTLLWFDVDRPEHFRRDRFPIYLADAPEGCYYGIPVIDGSGHKVARHYGASELNAPDEIRREITRDDVDPVRGFLSRYVAGVRSELNRGQVCTYTLSPDRHFILDRHPDFPNVAIATGFSGHGFKFAPAVGEIMADLAIDGSTKWPIDKFRLNRFPS